MHRTEISWIKSFTELQALDKSRAYDGKHWIKVVQWHVVQKSFRAGCGALEALAEEGEGLGRIWEGY